jgi:hypothetical protein
MIARTITKAEKELSITLTDEMVGKDVLVLAYSTEEVGAGEMQGPDNESFAIPEWHQALVLAEKARAEAHPELLKSWETVKAGFLA